MVFDPLTDEWGWHEIMENEGRDVRMVFTKAARAITLTLLVAPVFAGQVSAGSAGVVGFGVGTCGVFAKMYAENPELIEVSYFAWAQGLMSGINAGFDAQRMTNLKPPDFSVEEQQAFIRQYCAENPLRTYYEAALELYFYMRSKQGLN